MGWIQRLGEYFKKVMQNPITLVVETGCIIYETDDGIFFSDILTGSSKSIYLPHDEYPSVMGDFHTHPAYASMEWSSEDVRSFMDSRIVISYLGYKGEVCYIYKPDLPKRTMRNMELYKREKSAGVKGALMREITEDFYKYQKFI